jgi:hypothetical protein
MSYHIYLLRATPGEAPEHIRLGTITHEKTDLALEAQLTAGILEGAQTALTANAPLAEGAPASMQRGRRTGRKAKPVLIRAIDPEQEAYVSVRLGELIPSSMELSLLLGYNYNMASQSLSRASQALAKQARKEKDPEEKAKIRNTIVEATLRGVTFCYQEELLKDVSGL